MSLERWRELWQDQARSAGDIQGRLDRYALAVEREATADLAARLAEKQWSKLGNERRCVCHPKGHVR